MTTTDQMIKFRTHADIDAKRGPRAADEIERSRAAIARIRAVPQVEQRTKAWYEIRERMITTSDWGTVLGVNKYSTVMEVLKKKCHVEKPFDGNEYTQYGVKYEPVACKIYERRNATTVAEFGLVEHPVHDFLGASPDGITEDGIMIEIKVPLKRKLTGDPRDTEHYWVQMQGQLEVCDLERCDFLECKIDEISESDYFATGGFTTGDAMECGAVITFEEVIGGKKTLTYVYSDFYIGREAFDHWLPESIGKKILATSGGYGQARYVGVAFWQLLQVSCIPVYRDRKWFAEALPKLREFWNKVQYVRANDLPPKIKYADVGDKAKHEFYKNKEEQRVLALSRKDISIEDFF